MSAPTDQRLMLNDPIIGPLPGFGLVISAERAFNQLAARRTQPQIPKAAALPLEKVVGLELATHGISGIILDSLESQKLL